MRIEIDTHTHTIISGHAYSTLYENIQFAKHAGLYGLVIADHGPDMPGAFIEYTFNKLADIPPIIEGIRAYRGVEANISDADGTLDVSREMWGIFEFMIAALHDVTFERATAEAHTSAMVNALRNPYVDIIAHPGNPYFQIDSAALVRAAKHHDKLIEVNGSSPRSRGGSSENCREILRLCKKENVRVAVGSDAHFCMEVGAVEDAIQILEEEGFPEELIVNTTPTRFDAYLEERARRIRTANPQ
jgi:putative hydrolase